MSRSREIVSGWPRGKSTSRPYGQGEDPLDGWMMLFHRRWSRIDLVRKKAEWLANENARLTSGEFHLPNIATELARRIKLTDDAKLQNELDGGGGLIWKRTRSHRLLNTLIHRAVPTPA